MALMRTQSTGVLFLDKGLSSEYTCVRKVGLTWWSLDGVNRTTFTSDDYSTTLFRDNHSASRLLLFISIFIIQFEACIIIGF